MYRDATTDGSAKAPSYLSDAGPAFRRIYARVSHPEAFIPDGDELSEWVRAELRECSAGASALLDGLIRETAEWASAAAARFQAVGELTDRDGRIRLIRRAAMAWAPIGLASGAWLQWLSSPGTADEEHRLRILRLYASDVGAGQSGAARGSAYLGLLRQLRVSQHAVPLAHLTGDPRIADAAFRLPAVLLLMSRRPGDFVPELIGADLCLRAVGLPPPLALARTELQADWAAIDYSQASEGSPSPLDECRTIADALIQADPEAAARVHAGLAWSLAALRAHAALLDTELHASLDPAYDMAELVRLRAREGSVYHHEVLLEGQPLAAWLKKSRDDPRNFLDVLARSKLVKPGRSHASRLVRGLVSDRGPMFRIFSPDDLATISRWIDALPPARGTGETSAGNAVSTATAVRQAPDDERVAELPILSQTPVPSGRSPRNLREAYHALMTRNGSPELRDWSLRYVEGWLARTRHRMGSRSVPLPGEWGVEGLRPWLRSQHDRHGLDFEESTDVPLPSREAVVDDAVQLALLTLIDGSWLQGFTDYELASSDIGHSLFATYCDELGNGEPVLNHPLIYREVLRDMDVDLPPTASAEFANWPGFRDESFELPVYWLCIGRFPHTFLPEVLGLNLAMELSGVGGTYRRASMALRKYGFSTRFVDIHNTIDNVATGHSAWAADAVDILMSGLAESPGPGGRPEMWQRVRVGYRSLNPPGGFMARRAARRAQGWRRQLYGSGQW